MLLWVPCILLLHYTLHNDYIYTLKDKYEKSILFINNK